MDAQFTTVMTNMITKKNEEFSPVEWLKNTASIEATFVDDLKPRRYPNRKDWEKYLAAMIRLEEKEKELLSLSPQGIILL